MFAIGLAVPAAATVAVGLIVRPDSLMQWLLVAATPFVASTAVALCYIIRSGKTSA
jgi:hypothetical protein